MHLPRAVIFDLDGTLLNTLDDLRDTLNMALEKNGLPPRTTEEVRAFVGNGRATLVRRAVPEGTQKALYDRVLRDTGAFYAAHCGDHTAPYEGIIEMLKTLADAGYSIAVNSNKSDAQVRAFCERHFPALIAAAAGQREGQPLKPAPDGIFRLLETLGIPKERAVYIGDSDVDIVTAQNAGIACISVLWGFRDRAKLEAAGGTRFASSTDEVLTQIGEIFV